MRIICEVCKQEGCLQQLGNYYRVRHYGGQVEYGKSKFYYHQQSTKYVEDQLSCGLNAQKTLIKLPYTQIAKTGQVGVQAEGEHLNVAKTGLEQQKGRVRDSPSLVWGRPAKSVVERPRGFNSHIPRHFNFFHRISTEG